MGCQILCSKCESFLLFFNLPTPQPRRLSEAFLAVTQPSVQRKLHDEIVDMDLDRDPIYDDVVNMPYLEAVTWEVLRLSMAAPATNRKALTDVKVMGHM